MLPEVEETHAQTISVSAGNNILTEKSFWEQVWLDVRCPRKVNQKDYQSYRISRLLDACLAGTGGRALEVGAGNSVWLPYMAEKYGYAVVGVDYSEVGCGLLKANLGTYIDNAEVIQKDIFEMTFPECSFDVIFSHGFIEHFLNYEEVLQLLRSWLKPSGSLVTLVPNKKYIFRYVEKRLAPKVFDAHVLLGPSDLEGAYKRIGMREVVAAYFGSFSTWKYTSKTNGATKFLLRALSKSLYLPIHTALRVSGVELESKAFSPLIFAIGKAPTIKRDE